MKTIIRTAILAASFLTVLGTAAQAQDNLVYNRRANRSIGITPAANAIGYTYHVVGADGKVVATGKISSNSTFYIPTAQLKSGEYQFVIAGSNAQTFVIK